MGKTRYNNQSYRAAYQLYMTTDMNAEDIARAVGVAANTIRKYIREEKWETQKKAQTVTANNLVTQYLSMLSQLNEQIMKREPGRQIPTPAEIDTIKKLTATVKDVQNKASLTHYIEAYQVLIRKIKQSDADLLKRVEPYCHEIILNMSNE